MAGLPGSGHRRRLALRGVGQDPILRLNGQKMTPRSMTWGFSSFQSKGAFLNVHDLILVPLTDDEAMPWGDS